MDDPFQTYYKIQSGKVLYQLWSRLIFFTWAVVQHESKCRAESTLFCMHRLVREWLRFPEDEYMKSPHVSKLSNKLVSTNPSIRSRLFKMMQYQKLLGPVALMSSTRVYRCDASNTVSWLPESIAVACSVEAHMNSTGTNVHAVGKLLFREYRKYCSIQSNSLNLVLIKHVLVASLFDLWKMKALKLDELEVQVAYLSVVLDSNTEECQREEFDNFFQERPTMPQIEAWCQENLLATHWNYQKTLTPQAHYGRISKQLVESDLIASISEWDDVSYSNAAKSNTSITEDDKIKVSDDHGSSFLFLDASDEANDSCDANLSWPAKDIETEMSPILKLKQCPAHRPNGALLDRSMSMPRFNAKSVLVPARRSVSVDRLEDDIALGDECLGPKKGRGIRAFVKEKFASVLGIGKNNAKDKPKDDNDTEMSSSAAMNTRANISNGKKAKVLPIASSTPKKNTPKTVTWKEDDGRPDNKRNLDASSVRSVSPAVARRSGRLMQLQNAKTVEDKRIKNVPAKTDSVHKKCQDEVPASRVMTRSCLKSKAVPATEKPTGEKGALKKK